MRFWIYAVGILLSTSGARTCWAEVTSVADNGFVVELEREVRATPESVFQAATRVADWWDAAHTFSGSAANLSLDARAGGMFLEQLPGDGVVEHLRVTAVAPGKMLRMSGALGPLGTEGLAGSMTWSFAAGEGAGTTRLRWRYAVGGSYPNGFEQIAQAVDGVLAGQIDRLQRFAEEHQPASKATGDTGQRRPPPAGLTALTKHTFTAKPELPPVAAKIEDVQFRVGRWLGSGLGGTCEEVWSPALGGEMQGMFQFINQEQVAFRELFALRPEADGAFILRLKHFDAAMQGWEAKEETVSFRLLALDDRRAIFEGLTIQRRDDQTLVVYVAQQAAGDELRELTFEYQLSPL